MRMLLFPLVNRCCIWKDSLFVSVVVRCGADLSKELDSRIKSAVAEFCGEEEYVPGMLLKEIDVRVRNR